MAFLLNVNLQDARNCDKTTGGKKEMNKYIRQKMCNLCVCV